ncbi:MAG: NAD(P)/FAD-dependent oxidoreductase, partial [Micromonosporaceae bacterium]
PGPVRPPVDGLDGVPVWTNREATLLRDIPRRAVVIGGGPVGVELGQFLARMGSRVTIVQRGPALLGREEPRLGEIVAGHLRDEGVDVRTGTRVAAARRDGADTVVELSDGDRVRADVVVLGAGRRPRTDDLGLEEVGVRPDPRGAVEVDERCRVADGLWAVGDVTGVALFTHVAKYQARVAADTILGRPRRADYTAVPRVVFAQPEIAAVGLSTVRAAERGIATVATELDVPAAIARPWTYQTRPTGTLGLVADRDRRVLVGAWAVAPQAGEWIHLAALAIRAAIDIEVLRDVVPQFPTYTEAYLTALEQLDL